MVVRSWAELDLDDICAHARVFGFDLDNTLASSKQPMEPAMIARFSALTAHATVALISGGGMDVVTSQVLDVLARMRSRPSACHAYVRLPLLSMGWGALDAGLRT
mgnify:CR=1 FL=1